MSGEAWGAIIGLAVYFGMKAIDRIFMAVDEVLHKHGIGDDEEDKK